jgi:peroxiredoxin
MPMRRLFLLATLVAAAPALFSHARAEVHLGKRLTSFTLQSTDGEQKALSQLGGEKATVLIFVATRCPVSNAYNDRMSSLVSEYTAQGVRFVGINSNRQEGADEVAEHARQHGLTLRVYKDPANVRADELGAEVTPEAFVFDKSWALRYHGRIDDSRDESAVTQTDLRDALDALLSGTEVRVKETKAFGCTIKRAGR